MPVVEGDDMALLPFRGEIDRIGRVNADQLKRGGDEPEKAAKVAGAYTPPGQ
jgi:hypothetical protein